MRQDIKVSSETKDVVLSEKGRHTIYPFDWVANPGGLVRYVYGEVTITDSTVGTDSINTLGVYTRIPYTPVCKEFMVRFKTANGYIVNPVDGSVWFVVKVGMYGGKKENAWVSKLITISEDKFYFRINSGTAEIYNGAETDFTIGKANKQNGNMLLECVPTNNYRYPVTGVGLVRWTNSNIEYTRLSEILQREFQDDGVTVLDASYDFDTKDLYLNLDTSFVDREE